MSEQAASEGVPQRHLVVRAVLRTDVGLVRSENQDFGTYTTASEESASHPGGRLLIVADGMGGHRGGATASRLAGETVKMQYLGQRDQRHPPRRCGSRCHVPTRASSPRRSPIPSCAAWVRPRPSLAVRDHHGWLAHVGDSRIYLVRGGEIQQLTDDHSLVATMVREGLLTSQEAETHPRRNVLQRSMGVAEDVEIDVRGPFELREGDTFILCSDGLHGVVKEHELQEIAAGTIEEAADEFLRRALERGAPDNVTVIVARVEMTDEPPPPPSRLQRRPLRRHAAARSARHRRRRGARRNGERDAEDPGRDAGRGERRAAHHRQAPDPHRRRHAADESSHSAAERPPSVGEETGGLESAPLQGWLGGFLRLRPGPRRRRRLVLLEPSAQRRIPVPLTPCAAPGPQSLPSPCYSWPRHAAATEAASTTRRSSLPTR